jgi:hypothetical protein
LLWGGVGMLWDILASSPLLTPHATLNAHPCALFHACFPGSHTHSLRRALSSLPQYAFDTLPLSPCFKFFFVTRCGNASLNMPHPQRMPLDLSLSPARWQRRYLFLDKMQPLCFGGIWLSLPSQSGCLRHDRLLQI